MIKPDVLQMLLLGKDVGLETLSEAYSNYMNHYDCFFLIDSFDQQYVEFKREIEDFKLTEKQGDTVNLKNLSIDEAIKIVSGVYHG